MLTLVGLIDDVKCYEQSAKCVGLTALSVLNVAPHRFQNEGSIPLNPLDKDMPVPTVVANLMDLTDSIFASRHQPLQTWIACLYLMGLNLSNQQIAQELDLHKDDVHHMTHELRQAIADKRPEVQLSGTVEFDEVYVTAGHKGQPQQVKKKGERVGGASSRGSGARYARKRKAADLWDDSTGAMRKRWQKVESDAEKRKDCPSLSNAIVMKQPQQIN